MRFTERRAGDSVRVGAIVKETPTEGRRAANRLKRFTVAIFRILIEYHSRSEPLVLLRKQLVGPPHRERTRRAFVQRPPISARFVGR